jgi:hypothetical protein
MEYIAALAEIGIPVFKKWRLFYGLGINTRMNITSRLETKTSVTVLLTGEELTSSTNIVANALVPDDVDFMNTIGIEYKLKKNVSFNLTYSRDFSGWKIGASKINANKIKTDLFIFKAVFPFLRSRKLVPHSMLFIKR